MTGYKSQASISEQNKNIYRIVSTHLIDISVYLQQPGNKSWPVGPLSFPRPTPHKGCKNVITLSSPDKDRSGGLLCDEGDERVGAKEWCVA